MFARRSDSRCLPRIRDGVNVFQPTVGRHTRGRSPSWWRRSVTESSRTRFPTDRLAHLIAGVGRGGSRRQVSSATVGGGETPFTRSKNNPRYRCAVIIEPVPHDRHRSTNVRSTLAGTHRSVTVDRRLYNVFAAAPSRVRPGKSGIRLQLSNVRQAPRTRRSCGTGYNAIRRRRSRFYFYSARFPKSRVPHCRVLGESRFRVYPYRQLHGSRGYECRYFNDF